MGLCGPSAPSVFSVPHGLCGPLRRPRRSPLPHMGFSRRSRRSPKGRLTQRVPPLSFLALPGRFTWKCILASQEPSQVRISWRPRRFLPCYKSVPLQGSILLDGDSPDRLPAFCSRFGDQHPEGNTASRSPRNCLFFPFLNKRVKDRDLFLSPFFFFLFFP